MICQEYDGNSTHKTYTNHTSDENEKYNRNDSHKIGKKLLGIPASQYTEIKCGFELGTHVICYMFVCTSCETDCNDKNNSKI